MAEEKKESKGSRRYGNPPKIRDKGKKPEAEKPGDAPVGTTTPETATEGSAPKPDVMAGTDGISVQDRHASERDEMSKRQAKEMHQMHGRHAAEHEAMIKKHMGDMQSSDITGADAAAGGTPTAGQ